MVSTKTSVSSKTSALTPKNGVRFQVVSYERVSNEERLTGSHTFETQSLRIREKLDRVLGRDNYEIQRFVEDGVSGHYGPEATKTERRTRKVLKAALDDLSKGTYDVFIVYHTNRLVRNTRVFFDMCEDTILPNAAFLSATEELDMTTSEGRAMAGMGAIFSTMQRDSIVTRNRDAAATRVQAGYFLGQVPYGWEWEPVGEIANGRRRIRPVPEQGKWVLHIRDRFLSGWSLYKITSELNQMKVPPPSAFKPYSNTRHKNQGRPLSGQWSTAVVWRTLSNPVHAGLVPLGKQNSFKGEHYEHRYFDPEVRDEIIAAFEKRKRIAPTNTGGRLDTRLLNGLVHCGRCGKRMYPTWHSHKKYHVYRCTNGLGLGKLTCPGVNAREDELDAAIIERVSAIARHPQMRHLLLSEVDNALESQDAELCRKRAQLTEQLACQETDLSSLIRLLTREMITEAEFKKESGKLRDEQVAARSALAAVETTLGARGRRETEARRVRDLVLQFDTVWEHLGLEERREVMRQLIEKLSLERNEAGSGKAGNTRVETTVTLKLALLPTEVFALVHHKVKRVEKPTTGLAGLTKRQLAYLYWIGEGKTAREAAEIMRIAYNTIRIHQAGIRKRLGIYDMTEAARMAKGQIQAQLSTLPLEGDRGAQAKHERAGGSLYLSPKLMEILPLYASGASTEEVAKLTGLPKTTVVGRRTQLLEQTHSKTIFEACQKARKAGLL